MIDECGTTCSFTIGNSIGSSILNGIAIDERELVVTGVGDYIAVGGVHLTIIVVRQVVRGTGTAQISASLQVGKIIEIIREFLIYCRCSKIRDRQ